MRQNKFKTISRKITTLLLGSTLMLTTLVGCGNSGATTPSPTPVATEAAFNASLVDSTGTEVTVTKVPERIVSLAPSTTEILYYLGLEDKIVGRTQYCTFPESIESVTSVGKTSNPNVEAIVELAPDLVVASTHVSEEIINTLREAGLPVAFLNEQEGFEGTYSAITNIGLLTNTEEKAEEVISEMKTTVEEITTQVEALNKTEKPKVYYAVGFGEKDSTAGGNTFIGEIIELAGGDNVAKDVEGWSYSKEQLADNEPDMIIMPAGREMITGLQTTDFYKDLEAVKAGNLFEINGDMISRQGPRVADALVEMANVINPELNK